MTYDADSKVYRDEQGAAWKAIRRGTGEITGFVEVFKGPTWTAEWFTVPGASRYMEGK